MRLPLPFFSVASALLLFPLFALGCDDGGDTATGGSAGSGGSGASGGSGGDGGSGGSGGTGGGEFVMQPHPPFPVLEGDPAAVIKNPRLVTITFQGHPNEAEIQASGDHIVTSEWAKAVGVDYSVGEGSHLAKVVLPDAPPAALSEPDLLTLLDQHVVNGLIPAPEPDILYMIYVSAETKFDDGVGYYICTDYLGYHWQADVPSGTMTFAIVGDCGLGFEEISATFAHEYIEAASDPGFEGGYYLQLSSKDPWISVDGLENADLCDYADYFIEDGFTYQRVWSNAAAAAAVTSPCAPIDPNEVYYNVFSDLTEVPSVAAGQSQTFTLTGWSTGPIADWPLDYDPEYYSEFVPDVMLSAPTINNSKTVTITLTVPAGTPAGQLGTAMVYSGEGYGRFWPVTVRSK